jgi:ATP-dependent DNA helicase RecG
MAETNITAIFRELLSLPSETEWVEFKHNNSNPQEIGEYISAVANSAALHGRDSGYLVWGVEDGSHLVVGTSFRPRQSKKGNQELESWLMQLSQPRVAFEIHEFEFEGKPVVLIIVPAASYQPVRFSGEEFVRIGSYKKKLKDFPEKERQLWVTFQHQVFEKDIALTGVSSDDVLQLIDYPGAFRLLGLQLPDNRRGILDRLAREKIVTPRSRSQFDVTNLGAALFANRLDEFGALGRKSMRVIVYKGSSRIETVREQEGVKGYAVGFEGLIRYINDQLPQNELVGQALRSEVRMYPELVIRELVANALIHQDFSLTGTGPMVEIFADRIEISNPGVPLIDTLRFIDEPPRSRNESLAATMRRLRICEERGSGIDKVIASVESYQLPPPDFQVTPTHTRVVLYAPRKLTEMGQADRVRACYQHTCLCYVSNQPTTNATVRRRFGIKEQNAAIASRIIGETVREGLIKPADPENRAKKLSRYVPFWL